MLGVVNKLLNTKSLSTIPSNVLPLHLKQTFPPIIWILTEGDWIETRLPFKIFTTLSWVSCTLWNYVCLKLKEAVYGKQQHQLAQCRATAKVCKGKNGWQMRNWELPTTILPWFSLSTRENHNKCNVKSLLLWNMAINSRIELLHTATLF